MKRILSKSLFVAMTAALLLTGCAKESFVESDSEVVRFSASVTSSSDEFMTKSSVPETDGCVALTDKDGKINIQMGLSAVPGIDGISMAEEAPLTKGALINDNDNGNLSNIGLASSTINSFKVAAWTGTSATASIPAYTEVTYADSKWSTASTYTWKKGEEKTFVAYANLPASGATITSEAAGTQKLAYTVPDAASAQNDILMGYYKGNGNNSGTASITFYHPLTAVKFVVGEMEDVSAITNISLKGVYAGGNTTQNAAGTSFTWVGTTSTKTVSQAVTGDLPSKDEQVGEAFLLIPQTLTEAASVEVTINATINGAPAELIATLSSGQWKAGYTNIYTLGYSKLNYLFNIVDEKGEIIDTPTLTFTNTDSDSETQDEIVSSVKIDSGIPDSNHPWKIKSYQVMNSSPVTVDDTSFENGGGLNASISADGNLSVTSLAKTAINPGIHDYWVNTDGRTDNLDWSPADWTSATASSPIDLSKFDFKTDVQNAHQMTTANCYIIRHAGTYMFPLVYGNGVVNGSENAQSYYPNANGDVPDGDERTEYQAAPGTYGNYIYGNYRLIKFKNHLGNDITSAFIENNSLCIANDCSIVWQDEDEVIKDVALVGSSADTYDASNVRYIKFTVDNDKICQNNAVIAVKNANGDIMWSWNIWTTNDPALLTNAIPVTNNAGNIYKFFPLNCLGWVDAENYPKRDQVVITLEQNESGKTLDVTVNQPIIHEKGNGNYYQYGRKDPMCRKDIPAAGTFNIIDRTSEYARTKIDLHTAILNPDTMYAIASGTENWWSFPEYDNLWTGKYSYSRLSEESTGIIEQRSDMIKTIYDPSPVGYKIPAAKAFSGFTKTGKEAYISSGNINVSNPDSYATDHGWYFYTDTDKSATCFFPAVGSRNLHDGVLTGIGTSGYFWGVAGSSRNGINLYFYDICVNPTIGYSTPWGISVRPVLE